MESENEVDEYSDCARALIFESLWDSLFQKEIRRVNITASLDIEMEIQVLSGKLM